MKSASTTLLSDEEALAKLKSMGQSHLFKEYHSLTFKQKENLRRQITHLEPELFERQKKFVDASQPSPLHSFDDYALAGNLQDIESGEQCIKEGKTALLILAGGQGSRLRCKGPKGCFGITPVRKRSLFQLVAEKIKAASKWADRPLEVAIMTSPLNHVEVQTYFAQHAFFGLEARQLTFFYQRMWPFLNFDLSLFLEAPDQIARGPNGNGGVFRRLSELDILEKWREMGIEMVNVIPIDNPLADPFDCELFGFHKRKACEVTLKAAFRTNSQESVGVLAKRSDKKSVIVEYLEMDEKEKKSQKENGALKFNIANLGLYCFALSFLQKAAQYELPLHRAKKAVKQMDAEGQTFLPNHPNAWKYEEFIFDIFPLADQVEALIFPREECFAPLKNLEGEDSILSVQEALAAFDRRVFAKITGTEPSSNFVFELSPQFYYPTPELLNKWRGHSLPEETYIHE